MKNPFTDEYGLNFFGVTSVILGILAAVGALIWGVVLIFAPSHPCAYPYHLVYTGWSYQMHGKISQPTDDYACVPN